MHRVNRPGRIPRLFCPKAAAKMPSAQFSSAKSPVIPHCQLGSIPKPQLIQDAAEIIPHCTLPKAHAACDLPVGKPLRYQGHQFIFSITEFRAFSFTPARRLSKQIRDPSHDLAAEDRLAALQEAVSCDIIASGGISCNRDIARLSDMGLYGSIVGKAWYTGAVDLEDAILEGGDQ